MTFSKEDLFDAVREGEEALAALDQLTDFRLLVAPGKTLFDWAIECDNRAVIDRLAEDPSARAFAAPVEDDAQAGLNFHLSEDGVAYPIDNTERQLAKIFGPDLHYARPPLLTACRLGNHYAIEVLLKAGAKPADKDRLKLTAPELCFYARGAEGVEAFLDAFEASGQKPFSVNANLVRELLPHPELLERVKNAAKLGAPVKKLLFCYDCARLDVEAVRETLAGRFDINKSMTRSLHPVTEACTSRLFWNDRLPGHGYYAYHLTKYHGPAGSHSIHIDNDLIAPDGSNFDQLMREAERERRALVEEGKRLTLPDEDAADQLQRRCDIVKALVDAGLEIPKAEEKLDEDFFDELKAMGLGELARYMASLGFDGAPAPSIGPAGLQTFWELPAESLLEAQLVEDDRGWRLELVHSNVYGPVDGVTIEVRFTDDQGRTGDWQTPECWAETFDTDDGVVPRATVPEPLGEAVPWVARYRSDIRAHPLPSSVAIRLGGPLAEVSVGDWVLAEAPDPVEG